MEIRFFSAYHLKLQLYSKPVNYNSKNQNYEGKLLLCEKSWRGQLLSKIHFFNLIKNSHSWLPKGTAWKAFQICVFSNSQCNHNSWQGMVMLSHKLPLPEMSSSNHVLITLNHPLSGGNFHDTEIIWSSLSCYEWLFLEYFALFLGEISGNGLSGFETNRNSN